MGGGRRVTGSVAFLEVSEHHLTVSLVHVAAVLELGPHIRDLDAQPTDRLQAGAVLRRIDDGLVGLQVRELRAQHLGDVLGLLEISALGR